MPGCLQMCMCVVLGLRWDLPQRPCIGLAKKVYGLFPKDVIKKKTQVTILANLILPSCAISIQGGFPASESTAFSTQQTLENHLLTEESGKKSTCTDNVFKILFMLNYKNVQN